MSKNIFKYACSIIKSIQTSYYNSQIPWIPMVCLWQAQRASNTNNILHESNENVLCMGIEPKNHHTKKKTSVWNKIKYKCGMYKKRIFHSFLDWVLAQ